MLTSTQQKHGKPGVASLALCRITTSKSQRATVREGPHLKYFPLLRTPRMRGTIQAAITSASSARMLMIFAAR